MVTRYLKLCVKVYGITLHSSVPTSYKNDSSRPSNGNGTIEDPCLQVLRKRSCSNFFVEETETTKVQKQFRVIVTPEITIRELKVIIASQFQRLYPDEYKIRVLYIREDSVECDLDDEFMVVDFFPTNSFIQAICQSITDRPALKNPTSPTEVPFTFESRHFDTPLSHNNDDSDDMVKEESSMVTTTDEYHHDVSSEQGGKKPKATKSDSLKDFKIKTEPKEQENIPIEQEEEPRPNSPPPIVAKADDNASALQSNKVDAISLNSTNNTTTTNDRPLMANDLENSSNLITNSIDNTDNNDLVHQEPLNVLENIGTVQLPEHVIATAQLKNVFEEPIALSLKELENAVPVPVPAPRQPPVNLSRLIQANLQSETSSDEDDLGVTTSAIPVVSIKPSLLVKPVLVSSTSSDDEETGENVVNFGGALAFRKEKATEQLVHRTSLTILNEELKRTKSASPNPPPPKLPRRRRRRVKDQQHPSPASINNSPNKL